MLERVISGGQTGADQGALRAARAARIATGGYAPKGWETEAGPAPWLADFGLVECETPGYPARTEANVRAADATIWFGDPSTPGGKLTLEWCRKTSKLSLVVTSGCRPSSVVRFLKLYKHARTVNIAGNRESREPGIGGRTEAFLTSVFRQLGHRGPRACPGPLPCPAPVVNRRHESRQGHFTTAGVTGNGLAGLPNARTNSALSREPAFVP